MIGQLLLYDALELDFKKMNIPKEKTCQLCGVNPRIRAWLDAGKVPVIEKIGFEERKDNKDQVSAHWLSVALRNRRNIMLIDVREPHEWEICRLKGAEHHPVNRIKTDDFTKDLEKIIVFYCHRGVRSERTLKIFQDLGYENCRSLAGGIDAWAEAIEPDMPRY